VSDKTLTELAEVESVANARVIAAAVVAFYQTIVEPGIPLDFAAQAAGAYLDALLDQATVYPDEDDE